MWGEGLQKHIEQGAFCPLMLLKKFNVDLQKGNACPEKLLTEAPRFELDIRLCRNVLDDRASNPNCVSALRTNRKNNSV